jgi:hypothetical protein
MSASNCDGYKCDVESAHIVSTAQADDDAPLIRLLHSARQGVLNQLDSLSGRWTEAAATYGVLPQSDAVLCASGKHIARSIQSVVEAAESSRQQLQSLRLTLHEAIDCRIDILITTTSAAESMKVAALERELEKLDEVLESTRREHAAARTAVTALDDITFTSTEGTIAANLVALNAQIAALPVGPVESAVLRVDFDAGSLISQIGACGTVIAPKGVHASHVEVRGLPKHAQPGRPLQFELALSVDYPCTAPAELEAATASLVPHVHVDVSLVCGEVSQPLFVMLAPTAGGRGVDVSVPVPASAGRDTKVVIRGISVAGHPVTHRQSLPVHLAVVSGMLAPLRLEGAANDYLSTPVISSDGMLYAPRNDCPDVLVFSADGAPLPSLILARLKLSTGTRAAAFNNATATLLLADVNLVSSKLVAVDAVSRAVCWSTSLKLGNNCWGIAVLPVQGLVVASIYDAKELRVYRLTDGTLVATVHAQGPSFIAADPATATLYVSTGTRVTAFHWNGSALVPEGVVEAAGDNAYGRPLAVVPPAPGQRTSYLVVGTVRTPILLVFSLPDCRLVHTHTLEGMVINGLAADPSGTALAVCDGASKAVHVLPWPLPGMPPLQ